MKMYKRIKLLKTLNWIIKGINSDNKSLRSSDIRVKDIINIIMTVINIEKIL